MNIPDRKARVAAYRAYAAELWEQMDDNARHGIRFGLFPADKMREAERFGYNDARELSVALMDIASKNGGMRA